MIITLHCLLAKSNNRTRGQFYVFVLISFVHMHGAIVVRQFFGEGGEDGMGGGYLKLDVQVKGVEKVRA